MTVGSLLPFLQRILSQKLFLRAFPTLSVLEASMISVSLCKHQRQQALIDATGRQLNVLLNKLDLIQL